MISAILRRAAELALNPATRCEGEPAMDADGNHVHSSSPLAVRFCAIGAMNRAEFELGAKFGDTLEAESYLRSALYSNGLPGCIVTLHEETPMEIQKRVWAEAIQLAEERD